MTKVEKTNVTHYSHESIVLNESESNISLLHLDLSLFKMDPCRTKKSHNHKNCPYYHNQKDRIRSGNFYSDEMCEYAQNNEQCIDGNNCRYSHNRVE